VTDRAPHVSHVGVAVTDLAQAVAFYRDVLGIEPHATDTADGASIVSLPLGTCEVELLVPADPESPVARFLARRGPGIHHLCFRVPDLDAALASCRKHGYRLVDERPRKGAGGRRVAFIHPKSTAGILLELTE
jgi:methylmalonyl-CoA/ethylmalonyl-CoA epimerase